MPNCKDDIPCMLVEAVANPEHSRYYTFAPVEPQMYTTMPGEHKIDTNDDKYGSREIEIANDSIDSDEE